MTKKNGRPLYDLTDERFATIVGMMKIQCTQDEICAIFEVDEKTLNVALKRRGEGSFSALYKKNQNHGKASLRRNQWKAADKGVPSILIWLGKQHLGQKDQVESVGTVDMHHFDGWEIERAQADTPDAD
jgi:hypothetical protein